MEDPVIEFINLYRSVNIIIHFFANWFLPLNIILVLLANIVSNPTFGLNMDKLYGQRFKEPLENN